MPQKLGTAVVLATAMLLAPTIQLRAQLQAKREAKIAESEKPQNVKGGSTFQVGVPYGKSYESALNYLKRQGYTIDSAGSDTGQIVTALDIKGGYTQTGTRVQVTCIKDNDTQTSVRVVVTAQKRKKLLQTEPWGDAKANDAESAKIAEQIKAAIGN
jgi:hypothetical protein